MDDLTIESYAEMRSTHFHDGFELYYLLRGEKLFFVNDTIIQ
ncbi:cupin superfamily acireductone dioxygenase involved in methionine salvage [Paenibacillus sp. DS2015]